MLLVIHEVGTDQKLLARFNDTLDVQWNSFRLGYLIQSVLEVPDAFSKSKNLLQDSFIRKGEDLKPNP